jgi:hypothetical protein
MTWRGWILTGAVAAALASAPAASANTPRYASVNGVGDTCTAAAPCPIQAAINGTGGNPVHAGDEVIVEPGTYGTGTPLSPLTDSPGTPLNIHGVAGSPRPVIVFSGIGDAITLVAAGSALSHVDVNDTSPGSGTAINITGGGSASDVVAVASNPAGTACGVIGTLTKAICATTGSAGSAVAADAGGTTQTLSAAVRDVTAWSSGAASTGLVAAPGTSTTINLAVTNTIAHGTSADVAAQSTGAGGVANVALDHSSFATAHGTTISRGAGNVGTAQLIDPASLNFHELAGSPTVDAGAAEASGTDIYGTARPLGAAPDIGAAELIEAPLVAATGARDVTDKTATLTGIVNPEGLPAIYHFDYGTTLATTSHSGNGSVGAVAAGHAVTARVTGLRASKTYFVRLTATSAGGTTVSSIAKFTTPPSFKGLTIRSRKVHADSRHRVRISVQCPKDTPKRCTGTLTLTHAGRARFNVKAGKSAKLTVRLSKSARAKLARHKTVKVRATATAKDGTGRHKTTRKTLTMVR